MAALEKLLKRHLNFIGGEFVAAAEGDSWLSHVNPTSGQPDSELANSSLLDVVFAVQAANKAWTTWQKVDRAARAAILLQIATCLSQRSEELARIQAEDVGIPITSGLKHSLPRAIEAFQASARFLLTERETGVLQSGATFMSHHHPIGVVAIITPWSDPIAILATRVAAALASGNVVIAKTSEFAPACGTAFSEIIRDAGLPSGVFNLLQGRGDVAGEALVRHPGLLTLSFTGSTDVGRLIAKESAEFLKRTQLSLGARNPVLVFQGPDWEKSVPAVAQVTLGEYPAQCLRGSRLFIQESIYDQFLELYKTEIEKALVGNPLDSATRVGPLAHLALFEKYKKAVAQATGERGKILTGGGQFEDQRKDGYFVQPTVLYDLTLCSTLQQEDITGPLVTVQSFKYQNDAIKFANTSPFGQAAYLFENSLGKANRVAQKIDCGQVFVNTGFPLSDSRVSFGGLKSSGLSRDGIQETMRFFSRESVIAQNIAP